MNAFASKTRTSAIRTNAFAISTTVATRTKRQTEKWELRKPKKSSSRRTKTPDSEDQVHLAEAAESSIPNARRSQQAIDRANPKAIQDQASPKAIQAVQTEGNPNRTTAVKQATTSPPAANQSERE